jgi:phage shock protein PspC (stress-responsive transcriptional regulator)
MSTLARPTQGRIIAGVCSGIAQRFGVSVTLVRVLTAVAVIFFGLSLWAYIILWIVMPSELS